MSGEGPRRLHVLVVEDDGVNRVLISRLLEKRGHAVALAGSGAQALAMLEKDAYDVVLMDVQMPEMDGLEATHQIRQRERARGGHLPVVAMTAHVAEIDRERCLQAGMDGYLAKPFEGQDLIAVVEGALVESAVAAEVPRFVFDQAAALTRMEGDRDLLSTLAGLFLDRLDGVLSTIDRAVREADFHTLERAAHSLRGSAANFSAFETVEAARRLESMGRVRDPVGARESLEALHAAVDRLRIALERVRIR